MRLKEALDVKPGEVISLVGGGGKTTVMFALAHELASDGSFIITTTTTKIREPSSSDTQLLLVEKDDEKMLKLLLENMADYKHITLARDKTFGKLDGINPGLMARLADLNHTGHIIVEADGAARRSLKAPNQTEPIIPANTSLVIPVVGTNILGCRLTEETVFRSEIASRLLGMTIGEIISAEAVAFLITHPQGIIKGAMEQARIVPLLNKTDLDNGLKKGREIAREILKVGHPRINRIILGQAQLPEPVVEVITRR